MDYRYQLQKYTGRNSRHTCPACGRPHCFTYYVDAAGNPLASDVGRCEHINSCGYEKTPKMYFDEHPQERRQRRECSEAKSQHPKKDARVDFIPFGLITKSVGMNNNLMRYLGDFFPAKELERVTADYFLGCTKKGEIIFPQIDAQGRCWTGKVMAYGEDGHRIKRSECDAVDWLHARWMKQQGKTASDYHLRQCLFGEHLLSKYPDRIVCLTEGEKSAVIASLFFPQFVWVSCGGKFGLKPETCKSLAGRDVIVYADADAVTEWTERIKRLDFCKSIRLSDWSKDEPLGSKRDIADLLMEEKARMQVKSTTIGDVCRWLHELGIPPGRVTFNV